MSLDATRAPADARRAVAAGDLRLIGVYGYTAEFPGLAGSAPPSEWPHGVRMVEGTSDTPSADEVAWNDRARAYARRYNPVVVSLATAPKN